MSSSTTRSQDGSNLRGTPLDFEIRSSHRICYCAGIPCAIDAALIDFCDAYRRAGFNVRSGAAKKVNAGRGDRWHTDGWAKNYKKMNLIAGYLWKIECTHGMERCLPRREGYGSGRHT